MKHNVIYIGSQFRHNEMLYAYAQRSVKAAIGTIDQILFFDENDKDLFLSLQNQMRDPSKLVLICSKSTFSVAGKLLSTLLEDNQIVKEGMLLPSQTEVFAENSYLINYEQTQINVMLVEATKKLPQFLFKEQEHTLTLHIFEESGDDPKLLLLPIAESYDVSIKSNPLIDGWETVHISSTKYGELAGFITAAKSLLPQKVIATGNIFTYIIERLQEHGKKVTTAESCTGGLIATLFTKESGSSNIFDGAIVTYSNEKKEVWLGVEKEIMIEHGAVSKETVLAMSRGAKEVADADFALSVSGVAGPTGGSEEKPVGTVYLSICTDSKHEALRLHLEGDRNYIQMQAAYHAVKELILSDKSIFF